MRHSSTVIALTACLHAAVSGVLLTLSFPKTGWHPLAWICLVPILISISDLDRKAAFRAGICFGLAHFLTLLYWIVPTLTVYGDLPIYLAVPALILLSAYLALFTGLFCAGIHPALKTGSCLLPILAGSLWVGLEYLRSFLFTGFPWGLAGLSQYRFTSLIQIADITGVYGVSFVLLTVNTAAFQTWLFIRPGIRPRTIRPRQLWFSIFLAVVCLFSALGYGKFRLTSVESMIKDAGTVTLTLAQGNIRQADKWDEAFRNATIDTYCRLSRAAVMDNPDLIIWPETALPFYYGWDAELTERVDTCIRDCRTDFLLGSPAFLPDREDLTYFNRAYLVNRAGIVTGHYDKIHLVPFGEYVPLGRYLSFLGNLTAQAGDFSPGADNQAPLAFGNMAAGVLICFETIFPELSRQAVKKGAGILVIMTNDAWFGQTSAPFQHFSVAVFRAVENRRSVARAANTGISGFISPTGRILGTSDLFETAWLSRKLPSLSIKTVYTSAGDVFALICLVAFSLYYVLKRFVQQRT